MSKWLKKRWAIFLANRRINQLKKYLEILHGLYIKFEIDQGQHPKDSRIYNEMEFLIHNMVIVDKMIKDVINDIEKTKSE